MLTSSAVSTGRCGNSCNTWSLLRTTSVREVPGTFGMPVPEAFNLSGVSGAGATFMVRGGTSGADALARASAEGSTRYVEFGALSSGIEVIISFTNKPPDMPQQQPGSEFYTY